MSDRVLHVVRELVIALLVLVIMTVSLLYNRVDLVSGGVVGRSPCPIESYMLLGNLS